MADCYVDWSKIPEGKNYVAIGCTGRILSFPDKPIINICDRFESMTYFTTDDDLVPSDAIIGPLPPWRDSLIQRPEASNAR